MCCNIKGEKGRKLNKIAKNNEVGIGSLQKQELKPKTLNIEPSYQEKNGKEKR